MLRGRNSLDSKRAVSDAPVLNEAPESVVRNQGEVSKSGSGNRAGGIAGGHPGLDASSIVSLASTNRDGVSHQLKRNGTTKIVRDLNSHVQWL